MRSENHVKSHRVEAVLREYVIGNSEEVQCKLAKRVCRKNVKSRRANAENIHQTL